MDESRPSSPSDLVSLQPASSLAGIRLQGFLSHEQSRDGARSSMPAALRVPPGAQAAPTLGHYHSNVLPSGGL
jgi:hypothetical protein